MKLKKILAAAAAAAVAVSTMAVSTFALSTKDYLKDGTVFINADKPEDPTWAIDAGIDQTEVYGVTYHVTFGDAEWYGGGIGANSPSTGWKQIEWGTNAKEITADKEAGTITWLNDEPVFKADDKYAQFWLQTWTGADTMTVNSADVLGKDGVVLSTDDAPAAEETTETASAAAYNVNTVMVMQENATWTNNKSSEVAITAEGEYTYKLDGLSIDPATATVLYIKDAACVDETPAGYQSDIGEISLEYKSLKINGADVAVKDGAQTAIKDGIFDFALYNIWAENYIDLPTDTITSVELTVAVSAAAAAPAEETATAEADEQDEDEDVDVDVDEEEDADEDEDDAPAAVEADETEAVPAATEEPAPAPAAETATAAPATGNTAAATIVAVMAAAGAAAIVSKKRS